jgi:hypothetical protein
LLHNDSSDHVSIYCDSIPRAVHLKPTYQEFAAYDSYVFLWRLQCVCFPTLCCKCAPSPWGKTGPAGSLKSFASLAPIPSKSGPE